MSPYCRASAAGAGPSCPADSIPSTAPPRSASAMPWPISASTRPRVGCFMSSRCLSLLLCATACYGAGDRVLRVCADPNNLPFSNQRAEGFENRLADLVAHELGARVEYTWYAPGRGYLRNSLNADLCDVVMGVPSELDTVAASRPYYRSTYVFVSRHAGIQALDDPRLKKMRIGVQMIAED